MADFNKRIFGSNIDPKIKNKLTARQALADNPNPNESIQFMEIDGQQVDIRKAIGTHNFSGDDNKAPFLFELSSRTPWARAWVAVELYYHSPAEFSRPKHSFSPAGNYIGAGSDTNAVANVGMTTGGGGFFGASSTGVQTGNKKEGFYTTSAEIEAEEEENYQMEKKVYVLGDNNYNSFEASTNINTPIIQGDKTLSEVSKLSAGESVSAESQFPGQMENNPFKKPPAGITSIETKTEGFAGAIRLTTVNFVVHNFEDYQNIYARFFLKPGATIIVDFGWDTSRIYDPNNVVKGGDIRTGIYSTEGKLNESAGDLEVVIGKVTDFTSTTDENGSFICSLTIKSDNVGVVDYEISGRNELKSRLVDNIHTIVINRVSSMIGDNEGSGFLKKDWNTDEGSRTESEWYANSWANNVLGTDVGSTVIPKEASAAGLYWQSLGIESKVIDYRGSDTKSNIAISDYNNIFISWAFLEEEVLNKELGFQSEDVTFFGGYFDSIDSFVTYEQNLVNRQHIGSKYSRKKTSFKFLYPPSWDEGKTYDTIINKNKTALRDRPEKSKEIGDVVQDILEANSNKLIGDVVKSVNSITPLDLSAKRIPLRELFINLSVIKEAFEQNDTVSEAILEILDVLNEDSQNVFNLKLIAGTRDNSVMTVVDTNYYNSGNDEFVGDKFDKMFKFKPYSKGSIVKEMSLTYQTPNNSLQTMLAIQNKSTNIPLFSTTRIEDQNQAMRLIYSVIGNRYGIRHLPVPDVSNKSNSQFKSEWFEENSSDNLLNPSSEAEAIIDDYSEIINSKSQKYQEGEGKDLYEGLLDNYYIGSEKPTKLPDNIGSSLPRDVVYADALYAKDLEQYYEFLCRRDFIHKEISPLIPIELSLTTYGVSGILPGDIFNIDYLPAQYKGKTFFQVMNVEHSVDSTGWKTTLQTQLRVNQTFIERHYESYARPQIFLSINSTLLQHKISSIVKKSFRDFRFDESRTTNDILVLRVKGRLDKKYDAGKSMKSDMVQGTGGGYYDWRYYANYARNNNSPQAPEFVELKLNKEYILLIGNGGAIAIDQNDVQWKESNKIERLIKYFTKYHKDPTSNGGLWWSGG